MGLFEIPQVKRMPEGLLYLLLGIFLNGLGIIIAGIVAKHKNSIWVGLIMIVVSIVTFGLGGIWALIWGIIVFVKASD